MKAIGIEARRPVFHENWPRPDASKEVRVRVRTAGVCATDLALVRGYMNYEGILGHEFVGEILDGPDRGRRVVGELNAACGVCHFCREQLGRHCPNRTVLGILGRAGCFAEEIRLPRENLHFVPDSVSDDAAVFAEPLAAAYEIVEQLLDSPVRALGSDPETGFPPAKWLVAGDGRLGLLCAAVLTDQGHDVTLAGRHPERQERFGFDTKFVTGWLETDTPDPRGTENFDAAVEATGHSTVLPRLLPYVRPRGTVFLKTTTEKPIQLDLAPIVVNELTLIGSRCGSFEAALAALADGRFDVESLIDARYPLDRGLEALEAAARPGTLKVLIDVLP